ncbi:MAG: amidohydrolase family protein [Bryobacteraceae bacterium]
MRFVDVFNHMFPPRWLERYVAVAPDSHMCRRSRNVPLLYDLDARFRLMDQFGDYRQVFSLGSPPIETYATPEVARELARMANDEMAEIVARYPGRFPSFLAALPMNDPGAAARELERATGELGARGVQIYSNADGRPLDDPEFHPLFEHMHAADLPIFLHPARDARSPDYRAESKSLYEIWWTFGWPYDTSAAMARLVFSGAFDRWPGIKIVTHHMGGLVPYLAGRVGHGWDQLGKRTSDEDYTALLRSMKKRPIDYFHLFYGDTALFGSLAATRCGLDFFGVDRVLFASDTPFEPVPGIYIRETIAAVEGLGLPEGDLGKICHENAVRLLRLRM